MAYEVLDDSRFNKLDIKDLKKLNANDQAIKSDLDTTKSDLSSVTSRVTTAEGNISTNSSNISSLSGRLDTAESNISTNSSNISSLSGRVTTVENTLAPVTITAAENINIGKIVYGATDGARLADYSAEASCMAAGVAKASVLAGQQITIQTSGIFKNFSAGLTPNTPIYLKANGNITQNPDTITAGYYRVLIGYALNTTDIVINVAEPVQVISDVTQKNGLGRISFMPASALNTPPTIAANYCLLDGRALSRTFYSDLFALFGTTYGAGDGALTFNIPDWSSLNAKDNNGNVIGYWVIQTFPDTVIVSGNSISSGQNSYIKNPDFENGLTNWNLYNDGASATPIDGTGGTSTLTLTRNTTSPMFGTADMLLTKPASNVQGQGFSYDITLDPGMLSQTMKLSFYYKTNSAYVSGDLKVYLYDITNNSFVTLSDNNIFNTTNAVRFFALFNPNTTSTSYRLIIHQTTTNASSFSVYFDTFEVSGYTELIATAIGEWNDFTMSVSTSGAGVAVTFGTIVVNKAQWRRVGSNMEIRWTFMQSSAGSNNGGTGRYYFSVLPSGYSPDLTKLINNDTSANLIMFPSSVTTKNVNNNDPGLVSKGSLFYIPSVGKFGVAYIVVNAGAAGQGAWSNADTINFTNATLNVEMSVSIPISGWGSNINVATDFTEYASNSSSTDADDTGAGSVYGSGGSVGVIRTTNLTATRKKRVIFSRPIQPTDRLVIEIFDGVNWLPQEHAVVFNGLVAIQNIGTMASLSTGSTVGMGLVTVNSTSVDVVFGRYGIADYASGTANWNDLSFTVGTKWRVRKISNGNMAEQPALVRTKYRLTTGFPALTNDGKLFRIDFDTKIEDTHGAVSTGPWKFTAPIAGVYRVTVNTTLSSSTTGGSSSLMTMGIKKNSSSSPSVAGAVSTSTDIVDGGYLDEVLCSYTNTTSFRPSFNGSVDIRLNAGDFFCVFVGSEVTTVSTGNKMNIVVTRVGN